MDSGEEQVMNGGEEPGVHYEEERDVSLGRNES